MLSSEGTRDTRAVVAASWGGAGGLGSGFFRLIVTTVLPATGWKRCPQEEVCDRYRSRQFAFATVSSQLP